ncbi:hypothetical protein GYH30_026406 [Glycine max]|nr:hypothetical protein GYH30_026406 [Glycine max]
MVLLLFVGTCRCCCCANLIKMHLLHSYGQQMIVEKHLEEEVLNPRI